MNIRDEIVQLALSFEGQEEIPGNLGFKDGEFEDLMEATGWEKGQAWCAYFVELIWKLAYAPFPNQVTILNMIMAGGAVATFNGFKKADFVITPVGQPGDIVIWQNYKQGVPQWTGHAGIVLENKTDGFISIEGNTNDKGGREGYIVAQRRRYYKTVFNGLNIKGFVNPPTV